MVSVTSPCSSFTEYQVFCMLDQIKHTSTGLDNFPHWFLQLAAPSFSFPLSHLFNLSLTQSIIPTQWKTNIITSAKVNPPLTCSNYTPISITPILVRLTEKSIVKTSSILCSCTSPLLSVSWSVRLSANWFHHCSSRLSPSHTDRASSD